MPGLDPPAGPKPFGAAKARASINLHKSFLTKQMDCRVKPGNDSPGGHLTRCAQLVLFRAP
jgi:hypothetical protein